MFIKALYSLVIAIVVAVSAALTAATGSLGFLFAFGLQTLFFWALFIYRKQITARLVAATTGGAHHEGLPRASVVQTRRAAAAAPVTALVGLSRRGSDGEQDAESALAGSDDARHRAGPAAANGSSAHRRARRLARLQPIAAGSGRRLTSGDRCVRPAHASGRTDATRLSTPPATRCTAPRRAGTTGRRARAALAADVPSGPPAEHEPTPRSSHEDVMRRARELRERQRDRRSRRGASWLTGCGCSGTGRCATATGRGCS